jgi:hypothetical protein
MEEKSLSKTPAPAKDRIYGSKKNRKGSASSEKSAKSIKLSVDISASLSKKLKEFKDNHKNDKITLNDLKAVYRRGLGAYSSTHRPTISGGKPNTRNAWAMARVNAFLRKAGGGEAKKSYVQDDDLMKYVDGGEIIFFEDTKFPKKYMIGQLVNFNHFIIFSLVLFILLAIHKIKSKFLSILFRLYRSGC